MMEDDSKSTASTSTEFSTGSSVGSNTPSLIGENLESFCLGETEKGAASEGINLNILLLPTNNKCSFERQKTLFTNCPT